MSHFKASATVIFILCSLWENLTLSTMEHFPNNLWSNTCFSQWENQGQFCFFWTVLPTSWHHRPRPMPTLIDRRPFRLYCAYFSFFTMFSETNADKNNLGELKENLISWKEKQHIKVYTHELKCKTMSLFLPEILSWLSICESVEEINDPLVERLQQKVSVNHLLVSRKYPKKLSLDVLFQWQYSTSSSSLFFFPVLLGL